MSVVRISEAPMFVERGITVTGLAAPSMGATETVVWTATLQPGMSSIPHAHDHEETIVVLLDAGRIVYGEHEVYVKVMDCVIIPARAVHQLCNIGVEPWMVLSILPAGARMLCPEGTATQQPAWMQ